MRTHIVLFYMLEVVPDTYYMCQKKRKEKKRKKICGGDHLERRLKERRFS
jgi:hypothetical protein